jgi:hypothetical protein
MYLNIKVLCSKKYFGGIDLNEYKKKIVISPNFYNWSIVVENEDIK